VNVFLGCTKSGSQICPHRSTRSSIFKSKLTTRDRVLKNNAGVVKATDAEIELQDQGFTRLKILFILPPRNSCVEVINAQVDIQQPE